MLMKLDYLMIIILVVIWFLMIFLSLLIQELTYIQSNSVDLIMIFLMIMNILLEHIKKSLNFIK